MGRLREPSVPATVQAPPEQKNVVTGPGARHRSFTVRPIQLTSHEPRSRGRLGFPERPDLGGFGPPWTFLDHVDGIESKRVRAGAGFALALILMAGLREKLELANMPSITQAAGLSMMLAGILSMTFMGFAGLGGRAT